MPRRTDPVKDYQSIIGQSDSRLSKAIPALPCEVYTWALKIVKVSHSVSNCTRIVGSWRQNSCRNASASPRRSWLRVFWPGFRLTWTIGLHWTRDEIHWPVVEGNAWSMRNNLQIYHRRFSQGFALVLQSLDCPPYLTIMFFFS
jgi:hypothetical protein